MDHDLALALELSANDHRSQVACLELAKVGINDEVPRLRAASFPPPLDHHFGERHGQVSPGVIVTVGALNQFHQYFAPLIEKHSAPSSICGYLTLAHVRLLRRAALHLCRRGIKTALSQEDIDTLIASVRNREAVFAEVDKEMYRIANMRRSYMRTHPEKFVDDASGAGDRTSTAAYLKAWVANYEMSDALSEGLSSEELEHEGFKAGSQPKLTPDEAHHPPSVSSGTPSRASTSLPLSGVVSVEFARHNQFPELGAATHEEATRIARDEARFGGRMVGPPDSGQVSFSTGESVFLMETFEVGGTSPTGERVVTSTLCSPEEWAQKEFEPTPAAAAAASESGDGTCADAGAATCPESSPSGLAAPSVRIFALDVNGHFEAAFSCVGAHGNTLVVINSTSSDYSSTCPMVTWLFDLIFPPSPSSAVQMSSSSTETESMRVAIAELKAMGFSDDGAIRTAVASSGGSVERAIGLLLE